MALKTCGSKNAQQAGYRQPLADPLEMAVRGDAARQRAGVEQLLDAGDRLQLALQDQQPCGPRIVSKNSSGERSARSGSRRRHRGSHGSCRSRAPGASSVVAGKSTSTRHSREHPGKDQLAVDQHTVTIEDHRIGEAHAAPFPSTRVDSMARLNIQRGCFVSPAKSPGAGPQVSVTSNSGRSWTRPGLRGASAG